MGRAVPAATSPRQYQLLSQDQCPVTARSAFSIFQVIPLQSGLQVAITLQGGLGLDISADMDVNIWEQDLKTSINTRSAGAKLLGSGDAGYPRGSVPSTRDAPPQADFAQPPALLLLGPTLPSGHIRKGTGEHWLHIPFPWPDPKRRCLRHCLVALLGDQSHVLLSHRGGLTIDFQVELDAPFLQATLRSQTEVETSILFDTVLRFSSSPVLLCLQLREEQVPYR